jgi:hypothetical protein
MVGCGAIIALYCVMNDEPREIEEQGAKEEQTQKIDAIVGDEVLGYEGTSRGEHSGQSGDEGVGETLEDRLADNRPDQLR